MATAHEARGHSVPALEGNADGELRSLSRSLLVSAIAALTLVVAFNAVVDPYGQLGTGIFTNALPRDPRAKAMLLHRLPDPPQLLVLGSSRSMAISPGYLSARTGLRSFNAGTRGGTVLDAYAMARAAHDAFPAVRKRYLWLLDDGAFSLSYVPLQLARADGVKHYFRPSERRSTPTPSLRRLLSWRAVQDSWRVLWASLEHRRPPRFDADGSWRGPDRGSARLAAPGATLAARLQSSLGALRRELRARLRPQPLARHYFERTLALMARWGERPVIVISPVHPVLARTLAPVGWRDRHRALMRYLRPLQRRYRFELLDMSSIESFGGTPDDFVDGTHMGRRNLRLLVDAVLRRSGGALH